MELKLKYLDSVIKLTRNRIVSKNNDKSIETQLILGGVQQVLTSKFGFNREDWKVGYKWVKINRKKLVGKK